MQQVSRSFFSQFLSTSLLPLLIWKFDVDSNQTLVSFQRKDVNCTSGLRYLIDFNGAFLKFSPVQESQHLTSQAIPYRAPRVFPKPCSRFSALRRYGSIPCRTKVGVRLYPRNMNDAPLQNRLLSVQARFPECTRPSRTEQVGVVLKT